jgi:hypothetical protein
MGGGFSSVPGCGAEYVGMVKLFNVLTPWWIILGWILERWDSVIWTGLSWLRTGTGGELL